MTLAMGTRCRIINSTEKCVYVVRGVDPVSNRIWLAAAESSYEGYNGDIIIYRYGGEWRIALKDGRSSLPTTLELEVVL